MGVSLPKEGSEGGTRWRKTRGVHQGYQPALSFLPGWNFAHPGLSISVAEKTLLVNCHRNSCPDQSGWAILQPPENCGLTWLGQILDISSLGALVHSGATGK